MQTPVGVDNDTQLIALTGPAGATCVSVGVTAVRVWLPVLVTVNVYVMTSPTAATVLTDGTFAVVTVSTGFTGTLTGGDGGPITGGPVGGVPVLVALSFTLPLSRSAWVTVYVAVNTAT